MSLGGHLRELRKRFFIAAAGLVVGMVIAFLISGWVIDLLAQPIVQIAEGAGRAGHRPQLHDRLERLRPAHADRVRDRPADLGAGVALADLGVHHARAHPQGGPLHDRLPPGRDPAVHGRPLRRLAHHAAHGRADGELRAQRPGHRPVLRLRHLLRLRLQAAAGDRGVVRDPGLPGRPEPRGRDVGPRHPQGLARGDHRHHDLRGDGDPCRRRHLDAAARRHPLRAVLRRGRPVACCSTGARRNATGLRAILPPEVS